MWAGAKCGGWRGLACAWSWESRVTEVRLGGEGVWAIHTEGRGSATRPQDRARRCHLDLRRGRAWIHLDNTVLGDRGQSPKATRCATADREQISSCRGWGGVGR